MGDQGDRPDGMPPSSSATTITRCWPTLRAEAPVFECAPGFWTVARYEDIRDLSRDPSHFCSGRGALVNDPLRGSATPQLAHSILHMDPPGHSDFRGLLNRRFTPRALAPMAESIRRNACAVLDAAPPDEEIDFVASLAAPFPLIVIAELLGIPETVRGDFRRWSDAAIESPDLPAGETLSALGRAGRVHHGAHPLQERTHAGDDLVSVLVGSEINGCPLTQRRALHVLAHPVGGRQRDDPHPVVGRGAGARPASGSAGPGGAVARARARARSRNACAGSRPIHAFCRTATEDTIVRWAGHPAPVTTSACSTPRATATRPSSALMPASSRSTRPTNPMHVAFGFGEHVCLGASLARMEGRIFLEELLARYPELRRDRCARTGGLDHGGRDQVVAGRAGP